MDDILGIGNVGRVYFAPAGSVDFKALGEAKPVTITTADNGGDFYNAKDFTVTCEVKIEPKRTKRGKIMRDNAVVVNKGGTRSGKTWSLLQICYNLIIKKQGILVSVVGETMPFLKPSLHVATIERDDDAIGQMLERIEAADKIAESMVLAVRGHKTSGASVS